MIDAQTIAAPKRRATNLSISASALEDAKRLNINISRIAEAAIKVAIREESQRRYLEENREAIAAMQARVEQEGTLLTPVWRRKTH